MRYYIKMLVAIKISVSPLSSERHYRVSHQSSYARYSRTRYLLNGTTYHASSCVAMGPTPIVTGVATFSSEHPTVCSHRSKMSVSEKYQ